MKIMYSKFNNSDSRVSLLKADSINKGYILIDKKVSNIQKKEDTKEDIKEDIKEDTKEDVVLLWQDAIHKNHIKELNKLK